MGQPLDGKTRMLWGVVRRLPEYWVVRPGDAPTPSEAAFEIFEGRRVVFVLDDLNGYTQGIPDLKEFARSTSARSAGRWPRPAATARSLERSRMRLGRASGAFFEDIPPKLGLVPLLPTKKVDWLEVWERSGRISRANTFRRLAPSPWKSRWCSVRERFQSLAPEHKDTLLARRLLAAAGILPCTHRRLERFWRRSSDEPFSWETASMFWRRRL